MNCEGPIVQGQRFCSSCGQRAEVHRISAHEVVHDTVHYFTHADKSIFRLVKSLALQPGVAAREYVAGKRTQWFKPLNFLLIVAAIIALMTGLFYKENDKIVVKMRQSAERIENPAAKNNLLQKARRVENVNYITGRYSNIINIVATPFVTIFFWLAYRKRFNYFECLVGHMYFTGFVTLLYALIFVPLINIFPAINLYALGLFFLIEVLYKAVSFYRFNNVPGTGPLLKAGLTSFFTTIFWIALTGTAIAFYIAGKLF